MAVPLFHFHEGVDRTLARFVSRYAAYSHGVREEIAQQFSRGTQIIQRPLEAQFDRRGLTDFEAETAVKELSFHGLPEDKDTQRDISPYSRLSLFDSDQAKKHFRWTPEEHDLVVETLRESDRYGIDFIEVAQPKRPAPWNGYDKLTDAAQIAELTIATETPVADVIVYERENDDRADVVAALEDLLEGTTDDEVVITA